VSEATPRRRTRRAITAVAICLAAAGAFALAAVAHVLITEPSRLSEAPAPGFGAIILRAENLDPSNFAALCSAVDGAIKSRLTKPGDPEPELQSSRRFEHRLFGWSRAGYRREFRRPPRLQTNTIPDLMIALNEAMRAPSGTGNVKIEMLPDGGSASLRWGD
jgi:hypothetical protein